MVVDFSFQKISTGAYSSGSIEAKNMADVNAYLETMQKLGYKNIGIFPKDEYLYTQWLKK